MTSALPQTKAGRVIQQLASFIQDKAVELPELAYRRMQKELLDSMQADASEAYAGLGMLAVLRWDSEGVDQNFAKALQLDSEFTAHSNYAICLGRLGRHAKAAEHARIASALAPTNITALDDAVRLSLSAGELQTARSWAQKLQRLAPGVAHGEAAILDDIIELFDARGVNEAVMQQCNDIAYSLLAEKHLLSDTFSAETDFEDGVVFFIIETSCPPDMALALDTELGSRLFERVPDFHPGKYWVGYSAGRLK